MNTAKIEQLETIFLTTGDFLPSAKISSLSVHAKAALVTEAMLTPKPGLVDERGTGAHTDLNLQSMLDSATVIEPFFEKIAQAAKNTPIDLALRAKLGKHGRDAEVCMLKATGGSNAHRGAIWCLGLLVAAAASALSRGHIDDIDGIAAADRSETKHSVDILKIIAHAASIASLPDNQADSAAGRSHGAIVAATFGTTGAKGEARAGFPHIIALGLPHLKIKKNIGIDQDFYLLDTLMAIMSDLEDTCLLYRGGRQALKIAQTGAQEVLALGGSADKTGMRRLLLLDSDLIKLGVSPGGSADLLAATIFLDSLERGC